MARITLTNTGEGMGGVKVYDFRPAEADEGVRGEVLSIEGRTYREVGEGVLELVNRALLLITQSPRT